MTNFSVTKFTSLEIKDPSTNIGLPDSAMGTFRIGRFTSDKVDSIINNPVYDPITNPNAPKVLQGTVIYLLVDNDPSVLNEPGFLMYYNGTNWVRLEENIPTDRLRRGMRVFLHTGSVQTGSIPEGVTSLKVTVIGGGGTGGTVLANDVTPGAGGGGGGTVIKYFTDLDSFENYQVKVGAGGKTLNGTQAEPGGESSFTIYSSEDEIVYFAKAAGGGNAVGDIGGTGGSGSFNGTNYDDGGDGWIIYGQPGEPVFMWPSFSGTGDVVMAQGGDGGKTHFGLGGFGVRGDLDIRRKDGVLGGGGGGGYVTNPSSPDATLKRIGGDGDGGLVVVEW